MRARPPGSGAGFTPSARMPRTPAQSPTTPASGARLRPSSVGSAWMWTSFVSAGKRPNLRRKSSGVPMTQMTSASASALPRECWKKSGWSGGSAPRPDPLRKIGSWPFSAKARSCFHAPSHQIPLPATTAGRSAWVRRSAAFITSRGSPNARAVGARRRRLRRGLREQDVHRELEVDGPARLRERVAEGGGDVVRDPLRLRADRRPLRDRGEDRALVELLKSALSRLDERPRASDHEREGSGPHGSWRRR